MKSEESVTKETVERLCAQAELALAPERRTRLVPMLAGFLGDGFFALHGPPLPASMGPPSDAKVLSDDARVVKGLGPQLLGDLSLQHRIGASRERAGEIQILLDEDHRHPESGVDPEELLEDLVDDRGLDTLGRLVEQQELRVAHERASDGEDLLLAPREATASLPETLAQPREDPQQLLEARFVSPPESPHPEIFAHGEPGKDLTPLGNVPEAEPGAPVGRQVGDVAAPPADAPLATAEEAHERAQQGRLSYAIPSDDHDALGHPDPERHAVQNRHLPVPRVEAFNLEHAGVSPGRRRGRRHSRGSAPWSLR